MCFGIPMSAALSLLAARRKRLLFSSIVCLALFVSASTASTSSPTQKINLSKLNGLWEGTRIMRYNQTEDYRLTVENNQAWLQVFNRKYYAALLVSEKLEGEGVVFRLNSNEVQELGFDKVRVTLSGDSYGERVILLLLPPDKTFIPAITMKRPVVPASEPIRVFRERTTPEFFSYQDWQARKQSGAFAVDEDEARKQLKQTMARLKGQGGWRCLAQITKSVAYNRKTSISSGENGINRLYLIYSPQGNSRLIYGLTSNPPAYATVHGQAHDYPLFISSHNSFFTSTTGISLGLQSSLTNPAPSQEVAVTVFILGNTPGDYGTGCRDVEDVAASTAPPPRPQAPDWQALPFQVQVPPLPQARATVAAQTTPPKAALLTTAPPIPAATEPKGTPRPKTPPKAPKTAPATATTKATKLSNASCDQLAAHPDDKNKSLSTAGVADGAIDAASAIGQCSVAVRQSPQVARLHFQLGRAYWSAKQYDAALVAFLKAEELNYAPAYFYLGQAYEHGFIQGEKADLQMARDLYLIAASEGFQPAVTAYQEFEETWEIDFEEFVVPEYAEILYSKLNPDLLNLQRAYAAAYLKGVHEFLRRETDIVDPACAKILDAAVEAEIDRIRAAEKDTSLVARMAEAMGHSQASLTAHAREGGEHDMHRLVAQYGGCLGAPVTQFYANIKQYVREYPALYWLQKQK